MHSSWGSDSQFVLSFKMSPLNHRRRQRWKMSLIVWLICYLVDDAKVEEEEEDPLIQHGRREVVLMDGATLTTSSF